MISRCPQCGREVAIPPGVVAEAVVRCPICSAEYPLADALSQLPPLLIVVDPVMAAAESDTAADVTSVQSAATAEEAALLARQPVAEATGGAGAEADLFAPADEAFGEAAGEAAGIATGAAAESADGELFAEAAADDEAAAPDEAVAKDEAAATDQAEGVAEEESLEEGDFGIAGEEGEKDAEAEGAAALADFARLQEAKPEPSTAAKLRRKKGKNPVWQLGGVIGGAVVGLFLGYYVLNFFWGSQHDYLGIWLPGCPHTAKHRPVWLGGEASAETNGSSQNGGKQNSAAKSASERRQRGDQQNGKPNGKQSGKPDDASPADAPLDNAGSSADNSSATGGADSSETKPGDSQPSSPSLDDTTKPSASAGEAKIDPPSLDAPSLDMPKLDLPKIDVPKIDAPKLDSPKNDAPPADAPTIDPPAIDPPKIDAPSVNSPKLSDLMPDAPAGDRPAIDEPKLDMPAPVEPKLEPSAGDASKPDNKPLGTPGTEPGDKPASPTAETVAWKNPPRASTAELQSSLSDAWKVFGCNVCNAIGVVRIDGQEQPCPACKGKPSAEINAEVYDKMAAAAARTVHVEGDDPEARDAVLSQADQFFRQVAHLGVAEQLGRQAAERLQSAEGPRGGVALACVMGREFAKDGLFGATVELLGQPHRVGVFSNRSLGVAPGKKVILLGDVMVKPSENLAGAALNKPWIIWVGRVIEIDEAH